MTSEEAIKHIQDIICENSDVIVFELEKRALKMAIKALGKRKTGKWVNHHSVCSNCEWYFKNRYGLAEYVNFSYCPNCGTKMEVDNEGAD